VENTANSGADVRGSLIHPDVLDLPRDRIVCARAPSAALIVAAAAIVVPELTAGDDAMRAQVNVEPEIPTGMQVSVFVPSEMSCLSRAKKHQPCWLEVLVLPYV
jgi:hypothetical protein